MRSARALADATRKVLLEVRHDVHAKRLVWRVELGGHDLAIVDPDLYRQRK